MLEAVWVARLVTRVVSWAMAAARRMAMARSALTAVVARMAQWSLAPTPSPVRWSMSPHLLDAACGAPTLLPGTMGGAHTPPRRNGFWPHDQHWCDDIWYRGYHANWDSEKRNRGPPCVGPLGLQTWTRRPIIEMI
jgi:hypothetical protein